MTITILEELDSAFIGVIDVAARHPAQSKLEGFSQLPVGWNFGRGGPISQSVLAQGARLLSLGVGHGLSADVFPGSDDEVSVVFYLGDESFAITADSTTSHEYSLERGKGFKFVRIDHEENAPFERVRDALMKWVYGTQWNSLVSSTIVSLTTHSSDPGILPLNLPPTATQQLRIVRAASP